MVDRRRRWRLTRGALSGLASITLVAGLVLIASPASAGTSAAPEGASAGDAAIEQEVLDTLAADGTATFWVHLRERADLSAASGIADRAEQGWFVYDALTGTAEASQAGLRAMLDAERVEYQSFWITNTIKVTGDEDLLTRIAARPEVDQILADRVYEIPEPTPGEQQARINAVEWNIDRINAPQVWSEFGVTGEDIVVANMDTGVQYTHPALVNQYRGNLGNGQFDHNYNWFDPSNICGNPSLEPCDNNGHGTHTMGTIVGDDGGTNQIGVAPGARWIAAKGCESGNCSTGALLASFQWFLAPTDLQGENPDPARRPHVVNNSWGTNNGADVTYRDSVQAWVAAGIFPVFSNGNNGFAGCNTVGAPASYPESYGIGAFDINNNIAGFSSRGPSPIDGGTKPNISAPGVNVRSSLPGNNYGPNSGTSMAAPHVTGTVALMWSAAVALQRDIDGTRALLDTTAIDMDDPQCGGTADNNNVWGQGRLDAFAAVDQSPRGPTGTLTGTVTDAATGDPIEGATITITGPVDRERTTGADGTYTITLPVGEYTVTASAFGYLPQTAQATITEGQTTTRDFTLETAPTATVSGTITDGSGHGWPLYARIEVSGAPIPDVFTDPATGSYSFDLPEGTTVTLTANAISRGYNPETREITAQPGGQVEDFALTVGRSCTAPGYEFVEISGAFEDDFESRSGDRTLGVPSQAELGPSPTAIGEGSLTTTFASNNGFAGNTFDLNPTVPLFVTGFDVNISPAGGQHTVTIYWKEGTAQGFESNPAAWNVLGSDVVVSAGLNQPTHVDVGGLEITPGETYGIYVDLESYPSGTLRYTNGGPTTFSNDELALTTYVGKGNPAFSGSTFSFRQWNGTVHYDIGNVDCLPVPGGLLVGNVRDANTGQGLNDATVASDNEPSDTTTTFGTPDDPGVDDGFYILFSSLTGVQPFTATMEELYGPDTQTPDVVADDVVVQDFNLPAGLIEPDPTSIEMEVLLGGTATTTLTLNNIGGLDANFEISDAEATGAASVPASDGDFLRGEAARLPSGSAVKPQSGPTTTSAEDSDATVAAADLASALGEPVPSLQVVNPSNGVVDCDAEPGIVIHDDGTVENGYSGNPALVSEVRFADKFTPSDYPASYSAVCVALVTLAGGPSSLDLDLVVFDDDGAGGAPGTELGSMPVTVTDIPVFPNPTPVWASFDISPLGLTVVDGSVYIGVRYSPPTPVNVFTAADESPPNPPGFAGGFWWNNNANAWAPIQSAFGNYRSMMVRAVEGGADVPWLSEDPTAGTVPAGGSTDVTLTFEATPANGITHPGDYTAQLRVATDTPYEVVPIPVTMTVPPDGFGTFQGMVLGPAGGVPDATVEAMQNGEVIESTTTDVLGRYTLLVPPDTYDLHAFKGDLQATEPGVTVRADRTTTVNFQITEGIGTFTGKVTGGPGGPVPDATVQALQDGEVIASTITDFNGNYTLQVPPGTYDLHAFKGDLQATEPGVTVAPDQTVTVNFKLPPGGGLQP